MFKETKIKGVDIPIQGKSNLFWEFSKDADLSTIEFIKGSCGCTEVKQEDNGVSAVYKDNHDTTQVPDKHTVQNSIRVFLKDGKPLMVENDRGVKIHNLEKEHHLLTFTVDLYHPDKFKELKT